VLDGVFAKGRGDAPVFHPAPALTPLDVEEVLATVEARLRRLLERRGLGDGDAGASDGDVWAEEAPGLAVLVPRPRAPPLPIRRHATHSRYDPEADDVEAP
jgi:hypothetical protein